jgi:nucleoid-associated protein YgaU
MLALAVAAAATAKPRASTTPGDPRQLLHAMAQAVEGVRDYTMTLISQEWNGDGMAPAETLVTKWARPFKVYFKRLTEPHLGREILFVDGWNSDKLKVSVHAWPINFRVNLNPHGDLAMAEAKHPVDESSLVYLVSVVLDNFRRAEERGEAIAEDRGSETILGRSCRRVRVLTSQSVTSYTLPHGETLWDVEKKFDAAMAPLLHANRDLGWTTPGDAKPGQTIRVPRYYAARIDLWIDDGLLLPLRAEIYDERGAIFERFEHRDLHVNVGLGPQDFSPDNPAYRF